jgi:HEAT repeat protein
MMNMKRFQVSRSAAPLLSFFFVIVGASISDSAGSTTNTPQQQKRPTIAELVAAYEARPDKRGEDPRALAPIAEAVMLDARKHTDPSVRVAACTSPHGGDEQQCALEGIARDSRASLRARVTAAAHLINRRRAEPALMEEVVKGASDAQLGAVADRIASAPPQASVPILRRLLESTSERTQIASARALSGLNAPGAAEALDQLSQNVMPGTPPWAAATSARARLGRVDALRILAGAQGHMQPEQRLDAARAMVESGDDRGVHVLMLITRNETGMTQLRAAELLHGKQDEIFAAVTAQALESADPLLRQEALRVLTETRQPLPSGIARFFLDPDHQVRVHAAEFVLAVYDRTR